MVHPVHALRGARIISPNRGVKTRVYCRGSRTGLAERQLCRFRVTRATSNHVIHAGLNLPQVR